MKQFNYALAITMLCFAAFSLLFFDENNSAQWFVFCALCVLSAIIFWLFAIIAIKNEQIKAMRGDDYVIHRTQSKLRNLSQG